MQSWAVFFAHPEVKRRLPEVILKSRARSEAAGLDKADRRLPRQVSGEELRTRLLKATALLDAAEPHLDWISASMGQLAHVICVVDADGIVLRSKGDQALQKQYGLSPAFDWSERSMGTNGAGTAVAAGVPVAVVGPDHYLEAFQAATCVASPIRDPEGRIIGAINLSTSVEDGGPSRLSLIAYAAFNIEQSIANWAFRGQSARHTSLVQEIEQREERLRQTTDRLQVILDNAPVLIYLVDENGYFLGANNAWLAVLGIDARGIIGRKLSDVFPPDVASRFENNNRQVLGTLQRHEFEETYGGRTYLSVKVPVLDAARKPYAICGMSIDVTDRRVAEAALAESAERFRTMADGLPLIVWLHDQSGAQEFVNQTFCEFFGVTREEMKEGRWRMFIHPQDEPSYVAAFDKSVRERSTFYGECRVRRHDGEWRWIESWARTRYSRDGDFQGFVGTSADVTEHKETAMRLQASEAELRETDRRKDEFLAALGHELRNPLAPIRNASHILSMSSGADPQLKKVHEMMDRQVGQLVRLVDDLADVSRLALGKITLDRRIVDFRDIIRDAIQATQPAMQAKSHRFSALIPEQPLYVDGDSVRLTQAMSNLLSNAARYTPPPGDIALKAWAQGGFVQASVADNGLGISLEELPQVFDPFHQAHTHDVSSTGGLGIGLTLVKRFVELHGGQVEVSSVGPGMGSTFTVRLPAAQPIPVSASDERVETERSRLRFLLIDDNADVVESQAQLLILMGHEVAWTSRSKDSLKVADTFKPEVVVLDLEMPEMNGYETARALRRSPGCEDTTLIAQTGWDHPGMEHMILSAGFDGLIRKGEDIRELLALVGRLRS